MDCVDSTLGGVATGAEQALTVTVLRNEAAIGALRPDYELLERVCANTLPFNCFEWQFSWCRQLLTRNSRIMDSPIFHVVRDRSGACV